MLIGGAVVLLLALLGMAGVNSASVEGEGVRVAEATAEGDRGPVPLTPAQAAESKQSSCRAVVHIGDSTSEGLDSAEYLPLAAQRIPNRYSEVGVKETHMEVEGATSIEERFEGNPNAQEVAEAWKAEGFHGCWVLALGTNEAADVAAGSHVSEGRTDRKNDENHRRRTGSVGECQDAAGRSGSLFAQKHEGWDEELVRACPRYPNMRVYNWAADVKNAWFIEDGIHFTSPGYAARAELIAQALAHAFPAKGKSPDGTKCVVS